MEQPLLCLCERSMEDHMNEKTCTECGKTFPATKEYFYRDKRNKDEFCSRCETCERRRRSQYRKENPEIQKQLIIRRKEARRNAPCLIYQIVNTKTQQTYLGQTSVGSLRFRTHKTKLRHQKHYVSSLQEDWNKYGEDAFVFEIIEELPCDTPRDLLLKKEDNYIKQYLNEGKSLYNKELNGARGEDNPCARLTWDKVRAIRKEYAEGGVFQGQLGKKYGVSRSLIGYIIRNKIWKET